MKALAVIPARMASTRLPGKPLKDIAGKTLIERVWRQVMQCSVFEQICIATDSPEIIEAGRSFGAVVVETSSQALTGSDRVAEVMQNFEREGKRFDLIANVQGDMPFIKPQVIDQVVTALNAAPASCGMATIATPITSRDEFERSSVVKVVCGTQGQALLFSRAQIPFARNEPSPGEPIGLKHIGLYVFRPVTLAKLATLQQTEVEKREGLEQLRLLCNGISIHVEVVSRDMLEPAIEVDTLEDLKKADEVARNL